MTIEDAPEFLTLLGGLAEVFDAKFSEIKQQLYFEALKDLPLCDIRAAMEEAVKTCKFMPRPVELRTLVHGDPKDLAEQAWAELRRDAKEIGAYTSVMPEMPEAARALVETFGSWPLFCAAELSPEMWASKRKEFIASFQRHFRNSGEALWLAGIISLQRGKTPVFPYEESLMQIPAATDHEKS